MWSWPTPTGDFMTFSAYQHSGKPHFNLLTPPFPRHNRNKPFFQWPYLHNFKNQTRSPSVDFSKDTLLKVIFLKLCQVFINLCWHKYHQQFGKTTPQTNSLASRPQRSWCCTAGYVLTASMLRHIFSGVGPKWSFKELRTVLWLQLHSKYSFLFPNSAANMQALKTA